MNKDFLNLLSEFWKVGHLFKFLTKLLVRIYRSFLVRFLRGTMIGYPSEIRPLTKNIKKVTEPEIHHPRECLSDISKIKLATDYLAYDKWPDWEMNFDSHEQYVSLHRWNWLLRAATDDRDKIDYHWGISMARSWLSSMGVVPSGDASESYTIGERISNFCLFSREINGSWNEIPNDIQEALKYKAKYLSARLEFLAGGFTGNHIINNARALIFAGHCTNTSELLDLSRSLLKSNLPILIDKDGFLREGSSHYQFLFTRWILEIRLIASEKDDYKTLSIIEPFIRKLIDACDFFLVSEDKQKALPLFGDISPDCEPDWLVDLTRSKLSIYQSNDRSQSLSGWATLFQDTEKELQTIKRKKSKDNFRSNSDWIRLDFQDWTAIWHMETFKSNPTATHSHNDFGSLVLFRNGKEVIIDSGRLDYENTDISKYGLHHTSHTNISIDGYPLTLSARDYLFPSSYVYAKNSVYFQEDDDKCSITIKHLGFKRIPGKITRYSREFIFYKDHIEIGDQIDGKGEYLLDTYFQLPMNGEFKIELNSSFEDVSHQSLQESMNPIGGWRSRSYGKLEASTTIKYTKTISLPFKVNYLIINNRN